MRREGRSFDSGRSAGGKADASSVIRLAGDRRTPPSPPREKAARPRAFPVFAGANPYKAAFPARAVRERPLRRGGVFPAGLAALVGLVSAGAADSRPRGFSGVRAVIMLSARVIFMRHLAFGRKILYYSVYVFEWGFAPRSFVPLSAADGSGFFGAGRIGADPKNGCDEGAASRGRSGGRRNRARAGAGAARRDSCEAGVKQWTTP